MNFNSLGNNRASLPRLYPDSDGIPLSGVQQGLSATQSDFNRTQESLADQRQQINDLLDHLFPASAKAPLTDAMRYSVMTPGKRIRPLLTLAVVEYLGGRAELALSAACAIEMIHTASLILDDLPCMDNDSLRRNRPSTHVRFGEDITILAAVSLLTQSYCTVASDAKLPMPLRLELIQLFCNTIGAQGLSLGQSMDLSVKPCAGQADLMTDMHYLKTGALFTAAARSACMISQATKEQQAAIMDYTCNLGLAFQLMDDLQDEATDTGNLAAVLGETKAQLKIKAYVQAAKEALLPQAQYSKKPALLHEFADAFFGKR